MASSKGASTVLWQWGGHPLFVDIVAWACIGAFAASFAAAFCLTFVAIGRAGLLIGKADEKSLGWSERMARRNARSNRFLVDPEYRPLRRMLGAAWGGALLSFFCLILIFAIFGERAPRSGGHVPGADQMSCPSTACFNSLIASVTSSLR